MLNYVNVFSCFCLPIILCFSSYPQQSQLSRNVNYLSEFIASDYFLSLKENHYDLEMVDTIYLRAINSHNFDYSEALLSLTFATIPYKVVPIKIPLFGWIVNYPLIAHNDSVFNKKNENLPKYLLYDSPQTDYGDKDKLAHLFGNAFISYNSFIFDFGLVIGYFVEVFEEKFKVQSRIDERDLYVNYLGYLFGKELRKNNDVMPSRFFLIPALFKVRYTP